MPRQWLALILAAMLAVAGCSSDDDSETGNGAADTTDATTEPTGTTDTTEASSGEGQGGPTITVEPATDLADGQTVTVTGAGFTPGVTLGVTQCADLGDATGAGDCDLGAIITVQVGDDGTAGPVEYIVNGGPFGANERVCDADNPCVLSLGELVAEADAERATAELSFA